MINKVFHLKFKCIVLSCFVQKSTEHICFDLLLNFPPNMLIRLGNLSWFVTEALGGNGLTQTAGNCALEQFLFFFMFPVDFVFS